MGRGTSGSHVRTFLNPWSFGGFLFCFVFHLRRLIWLLFLFFFLVLSTWFSNEMNRKDAQASKNVLNQSLSMCRIQESKRQTDGEMPGAT